MNMTDTTYTTQQVMNNGEFEHLIDVVSLAKKGKHWELEMLTDCDFDWASAANQLLEKRAAELLLNEMSNEDLMSIAIGELDVNELYRAI